LDHSIPDFFGLIANLSRIFALILRGIVEVIFEGTLSFVSLIKFLGSVEVGKSIGRREPRAIGGKYEIWAHIVDGKAHFLLKSITFNY